MNQTDKTIDKIVSQETRQKFTIYERLLREWNRRTLLVQEDTLSDFCNRHVLDSLQLIPIMGGLSLFPPFSGDQDASSLSRLKPARDNEARWDDLPQFKNFLSIIDVGSGAGFPGMILAICGFGKVTLCESNQKKCFFLEEVARQTNTDVVVVNDRVENVKEKFNVIVSRACADLERLLEMMALLSSSASSYGLFPKGRSWKEEVVAAQKKWRFLGTFTESITSKDGVILSIHHLERRNIF